MLIRHAESEHNEAERNWDLKGLLLKRDHGITTAGYAQCDALHEYVAEQRADAASPWADARLELYASPLTRAIQTALIATDGIDKPLVLLPDARELGAGPIAGRDSLGAAVGVLEILDRVSDESARPLEIERVEAEDIEKNGAAKALKGYGGILVPGGFGERGTEGKILAAQYARENNVPYFGLCLGMQIATIEFARNVLNLEGAHSVEFDADTPHPVIALLDEQQNVTDKGGTMRLGSQPCKLTPDSLAAKLYGSEEIHERHRHRYEFNNAYREQFESAGLVFSGQSPDGGLVEIVEVPDHSFYLASQFHPEFKSKPNEPHPLFQGFIAAAHACDHNKNV